VPMIGGMARLGKWFINSGMRRGTPKQDHEKVITVYGDAGDWKKRLGCEGGKKACLVLLDRDGRIRWVRESLYGEGAMRDLQAVAEELLASGG